MQEQNIEYAGFWIRVCASLIDTFLLIVAAFPLLILVYGWSYLDAMKTGTIAGPADIVINWVLPSIAIVIFWLVRQATPGKIMLSLRIVDEKTGGKLSLGQCIGRYFAYFVSTVPFGLGLLWVAIDKKKQGWHDKLCGTVVIREKR